jgi:hypothetical protein
MARIHRKTQTFILTDLADIHHLASKDNLTYEEAFNIVKEYVQLASNKPYTDISISYAYLDILKIIEKTETQIKGKPAQWQ